MGIRNPRKIVCTKFSSQLVALLVICLAIAMASWAHSLSDSDVSDQIERLKSHDPKVRLEAAEALRRRGPAARAAIPSLMQVLSADPDRGVRATAARTLGEMWPAATEAIPVLIQALSKDSNGMVRMLAAQALGELKTTAKPAIPALIQALREDTDKNVRGFAAFALGQIGPQEAKVAIPELIHLVIEDESGSGLAASTLGRMGPEAIPPLIDVLTKESRTHPRTVAADILGHLGPQAKAAVPPLVRLLVVELREAHRTGRQAVDVRRGDFAAVATGIGIAEIVSKNQKDVRPRLGRTSRPRRGSAENLQEASAIDHIISPWPDPCSRLRRNHPSRADWE